MKTDDTLVCWKSLPRLWWLNPWRHVIRLDNEIDWKRRLLGSANHRIDDLETRIARLQAKCAELTEALGRHAKSRKGGRK